MLLFLSMNLLLIHNWHRTDRMRSRAVKRLGNRVELSVVSRGWETKLEFRVIRLGALKAKQDRSTSGREAREFFHEWPMSEGTWSSPENHTPTLTAGASPLKMKLPLSYVYSFYSLLHWVVPIDCFCYCISIPSGPLG